MEEKEEMKQSQHSGETNQEEDGNCDDEPTEGNKEITILEQNQKLEESKEEGNKNEGEAVKDGETKKENLAALLKKPKQNQKSKLTVPQPFNLATDKRMSRERLGGSEQSKVSKPLLSKSGSLNLKVGNQTPVGNEQRSEQRRGTAITSGSPITSNGRVEKRSEIGPKMKEKVQGKEVESKKSRASAKEVEEAEIKKLKNSSTFKASPLPSFYHRKDHPPKPELKKVPVTRPKSPQLGQRSKSMIESGNNKTEAINKRVSRTISNSAKETIHKLLRGALKAPRTQQKDMVKSSSSSSISHGGRMDKEGGDIVVSG